MGDASALVEYLLRTEWGGEFQDVIEDPGTDLHVPALCDVEVASVLRRSLLAEDLSPRRAGQALDDYRDLPLIRHGHIALLERVLQLRENFSTYDAVYVALAERFEAALLTADRSLRRAVARHTRVELRG